MKIIEIEKICEKCEQQLMASEPQGVGKSPCCKLTEYGITDREKEETSEEELTEYYEVKDLKDLKLYHGIETLKKCPIGKWENPMGFI